MRKWPNIINSKLFENKFNKKKIDFLKYHAGLKFYNMDHNKIIKRIEDPFRGPVNTNQPCGDIDFYQRSTQIFNLSDYDNGDGLFTKLYSGESYGNDLKQRIKNIIDNKIENKKQLPYNFSYKDKGQIYKYIFTDENSHYFYEFKENIYFDVQLLINIKVGIVYNGKEYFSTDEYPIKLYNLILNLNEDNKIENISDIEDPYKIIEQERNIPIGSEITYIFNFVGFESKIIFDLIKNENTDLDKQEDTGETSDGNWKYAKIASFFRRIKQNDYLKIIKNFETPSMRAHKLSGIKEEIIKVIGDKDPENFFKNIIENLDNCIITTEYIFNLHWNLYCLKSNIIDKNNYNGENTEMITKIKNGYNINYFDNKTDKMGIPNILYSEIYREYYIKKKEN